MAYFKRRGNWSRDYALRFHPTKYKSGTHDARILWRLIFQLVKSVKIVGSGRLRTQLCTPENSGDHVG